MSVEKLPVNITDMVHVATASEVASAEGLDASLRDTPPQLPVQMYSGLPHFTAAAVESTVYHNQARTFTRRASQVAPRMTLQTPLGEYRMPLCYTTSAAGTPVPGGHDHTRKSPHSVASSEISASSDATKQEVEAVAPTGDPPRKSSQLAGVGLLQPALLIRPTSPASSGQAASRTPSPRRPSLSVPIVDTSTRGVTSKSVIAADEEEDDGAEKMRESPIRQGFFLGPHDVGSLLSYASSLYDGGDEERRPGQTTRSVPTRTDSENIGVGTALLPGRGVPIAEAGTGDYCYSIIEVLSETGDTEEALSPSSSVSCRSRRTRTAGGIHSTPGGWRGGSRAPGAVGFPSMRRTSSSMYRRELDRATTAGSTMQVRPGFRHTNHVYQHRVEKNKEGPVYVNEYLISKMIGSGACGRVYLAYDTRHNRKVAIKEVPRPRYPKDRFGRGGSENAKFEAFQKEVRVMQRLRHKNIVSVYEVIDDPTLGSVYLVMKYIAKGPIALPIIGATQAPTYEPIPPAKLAGYARQMLAGLEYLHCHKVVHRDIKPDNILVDENDQVYLADFGVAETLDTDFRARIERQMQQSLAMSQALSNRGERLEGPMIVGLNGTLLYLAPELWHGNCNGEPVDMWAMGVTLYTLLIGRLPFHSPEECVSTTPLVPAHFGPLWAELINGMLDKNPQRRLTAHDARSKVKCILESEKGGVPEDAAATLLRLQREAAAKGVAPAVLRQTPRTFVKVAHLSQSATSRHGSTGQRTADRSDHHHNKTCENGHDGDRPQLPVSEAQAAPVALSTRRAVGVDLTTEVPHVAVGLVQVLPSPSASASCDGVHHPMVPNKNRRRGSVFPLGESLNPATHSSSSRTEAYTSTAAPSPLGTGSSTVVTAFPSAESETSARTASRSASSSACPAPPVEPNRPGRGRRSIRPRASTIPKAVGSGRASTLGSAVSAAHTTPMLPSGSSTQEPSPIDTPVVRNPLPVARSSDSYPDVFVLDAHGALVRTPTKPPARHLMLRGERTTGAGADTRGSGDLATGHSQRPGVSTLACELSVRSSGSDADALSLLQADECGMTSPSRRSPSGTVPCPRPPTATIRDIVRKGSASEGDGREPLMHESFTSAVPMSQFLPLAPRALPAYTAPWSAPPNVYTPMGSTAEDSFASPSSRTQRPYYPLTTGVDDICRPSRNHSSSNQSGVDTGPHPQTSDPLPPKWAPLISADVSKDNQNDDSQ